jgi:hypothetical protein
MESRSLLLLGGLVSDNRSDEVMIGALHPSGLRHWPKSSWADSPGNPEETVRHIAALVEAFVSGAAKQAPLQVSLTAGYDSRMLLACSRPSLPAIRFYTDAIPDFYARVDCACARRIAKRFALDHSITAWREATKEEIDNWLHRTGSCVVDRITRNAGMDQQSDPKRIKLLGWGGVKLAVGSGGLMTTDFSPFLGRTLAALPFSRERYSGQRSFKMVE